MSWGSEATTKVQRIVPRYSCHFKKQSGFGLVETCISMLLLAGFLLSACHLLLTIFSTKLLDQTASKLINSFQMARQVAIESNTRVMIKPVSNDWNKGWEVVSIQPDPLQATGFNQLVFKQHEMENAVKFIGDDELTVVFKPNGMTDNLNPLGNNGIILCNGNGKGRLLTMLASGQVSVTDINQGCGVS